MESTTFDFGGLLKPVVVIADTHLGLLKDTARCDLERLRGFLEFLVEWRRKGAVKVWIEESGRVVERVLEAPGKIVFLGDFIELWDSTDESVAACFLSLIDVLSEYNEIIYLLGNHDANLREVIGKYFLGKARVEIVDDCFCESIYGRKYLFIHGHQFDTAFRFTAGAWKIMAYVREYSASLGGYPWVLTLALIAALILKLLFVYKIWGEIAVLTLLSAPKWVTTFGRKIYNKLFGVRYKRKRVYKGLKKWLKKRLEEEASEITVVYGHTHIADYLEFKIKNTRVIAINVPSWVRERKVKSVFRDAFLYIRDKPYLFGWDWVEKRIFHISWNMIRERRRGEALKVEKEKAVIGRHELATSDLEKLGWPERAVSKWERKPPVETTCEV